MKKNTIAIIIFSVLVVLTIIYGFLDGGSPRAAQEKRYDDKRIQDIQNIRSWVGSYYRTNQALPSTTSQAFQLNNSSGGQVAPVDPETNLEYSYQIIGSKEYKLCSTFATDTIKDTPTYLSEYAHPKGLHCFTFNGEK